MSDRCQAYQAIPVAFGTGTAQLFCGLLMAHQGALHFDTAARVYWMAQPAFMSKAEDIPAAVRMNEDIPAGLQREWGHAAVQG